MFMHCDVIDILKHRNEYLKRKEHFINKVVELWNAREPQEITLLASWLELCVVDPDLIAEIYSRLDLGDSLKEIQLEHQHNV